jgi:hypothetical protein
MALALEVIEKLLADYAAFHGAAGISETLILTQKKLFQRKDAKFAKKATVLTQKSRPPTGRESFLNIFLCVPLRSSRLCV